MSDIKKVLLDFTEEEFEQLKQIKDKERLSWKKLLLSRCLPIKKPMTNGTSTTPNNKQV